MFSGIFIFYTHTPNLGIEIAYVDRKAAGEQGERQGASEGTRLTTKGVGPQIRRSAST